MPWAADGKNFSDRLWRDKAALLNRLQTTFSEGFIRGQPLPEIADAMRRKLDSSRKAAIRLVRTESAAMSAAARNEGYKELAVERYEYLATLDMKTSRACREMDKRVFLQTEYQPGLTAPPLHPNCRSTTVPYFADEFAEREQRAAPDAGGKTVSVNNDLSYPEWHKKYVESDPAFLREEKKKKNLWQDTKQWERYQKKLGKGAPKTLSQFQEIKYNDEKGWSTLQDTYQNNGRYLQHQLPYLHQGEQLFLPQNTVLQTTKTIAGKGSKTEIRVEDALIQKYGGKKGDWKKRAGKIESARYSFDVHWYELDGVQYEMKLKHRKELP